MDTRFLLTNSSMPRNDERRERRQRWRLAAEGHMTQSGMGEDADGSRQAASETVTSSYATNVEAIWQRQQASG